MWKNSCLPLDPIIEFLSAAEKGEIFTHKEKISTLQSLGHILHSLVWS